MFFSADLKSNIEGEDDKEEEEEEEEKFVPKQNPIMSTAPKKAPPKASASLHYKADEMAWVPAKMVSSHIYPAKGFMREQILLEPPASFDGRDGSYVCGIDQDA